MQNQNRDWICSNCSASNFRKRDQCITCLTQKQPGGNNEVKDPSNIVKQGDWNCPKCGINNFASRKQCFKCHTDKNQEIKENKAQDKGEVLNPSNIIKQGDWICKSCEINNFAQRKVCYKCKTDKHSENIDKSHNQAQQISQQVSNIQIQQKKDDWNCKKCSFLNFKNRDICKNCRTKKQNDNNNIQNQIGTSNKQQKKQKQSLIQNEKTFGKCIIIPGNGCTGNVRHANWYGHFERKLETKKYSNLFQKVELNNMPDPVNAKECVWVPFIKKIIGQEQQDNIVDGPSNTVLVGHSSGAVCALRLLEGLPEGSKPFAGCVLVSACHTDLGDEHEAQAGYYNRAWDWEKIKRNAKWIVQFHGTDDPFIPLSESRHIAQKLQLGNDYHEIKNGSHFFEPFKQLPESIQEKADIVIAEREQQQQQQEQQQQQQQESQEIQVQQQDNQQNDHVFQEIECCICSEVIYQCVSVIPCLHNICQHCCLNWLQKNDKCPLCNDQVLKIKKNATINNMIEALLKNNPEKQLSQEELNKRNQELQFPQNKVELTLQEIQNLQ